MKTIFFYITCLYFHTAANAQHMSLAGSWQGKLEGTALTLVFHLAENNNGLSGTWDSPNQGVLGLPIESAQVSNDSLLLTFKTPLAQYKGAIKDSIIIGKWYQSGAAFGLNLIKGALPTAGKPQTPKPPFPYDVEEVEYDNSNKSVHFGATFTKPKGNGPFTTVILISGSGTQDRDGAVFGHKPLAVLADYLTRQGIAVLRVDDRGIGKSTLGQNPGSLTSADFANDVETSMAYLKSRTDVHKKRLGLIGHSEGGMIAPMVAARNKDVAFIVLLAAPGQSGNAIWNYQMQRAFVQEGLLPADKQKAESLVIQMNAAFGQHTSLPVIQQQMTATYKQFKSQVSDSVEKTLFKIPVASGFQQLAVQYQTGLHWLHYFLNYEPALALQKVNCPVLALNGELDIQVPAKENLAAIEAALKKGGHKTHVITALPHLNHLFQTARYKEQSYAEIDETFSPAAMAIIAAWLTRQQQ